MRVILGLLILLTACNSGPQKDAVSFKDLESLQGNWSGTQALLLSDDKTVINYPAKLLATLLKDSLELSITNAFTDGHQETEKGILSINENSSMLILGGSEYQIREVIRTNDDLTISAYKEDEDNEQQAKIRLTINIKATELMILREVKYLGTVSFLKRIDLKLKKDRRI